MRSFSKKLAFVLAAAMVVTAFAPAAKAEAAKEMAINKQGKILYVTDGKGINDAAQVGGGKGNVSSYDFAVSNKPADWKTAYTFAWSSSDEDVITVKNGGLTTAVGVGKADVVCVVTEKATGKATTLKNTVTVKANAADVVITNADDYANTAVEVGDVVDLNRAMYDANGTKAPKRGVVVTDYTRWMAEPATGVKIDSTKGTFEFTEEAVAGEYKLWCETYQSNKYKATTAKSDVVKVELVKEMTFDVVQNTTTKFTVYFNNPVKSLTVKDVEVIRNLETTAGTYPYPQTLKKVELAKDKMSATVEIFQTMMHETNYTIKVKDHEDYVLTASNGKPVRMELKAKDMNPGIIVYTGAPTEIQYTLYDAKDVQVQLADGEKVRLTLDRANSSKEVSFSGDKLTIRKNTASATVTATYQGYKENGKFVGDFSTSEVFFAEDAPEVVPVRVEKYTLNADRWWWGHIHSFQMSEHPTLLIGVVDSKGENGWNKQYSATNNAFAGNSNGGANKIVFEAMNPEICVIDGQGKLTGIKPGVATFYVKYEYKDNNKKTQVYPFDEITIEVLADSYVDYVTISEGSKTVGTAEGYASGDVFVLGHDQYNNRTDLKNVSAVSIKTLTEFEDDTKTALANILKSNISKQDGYWDGANKDAAKITIKAVELRAELVKAEEMTAADDGECISIDFEATFDAGWAGKKTVEFTVTIQEPSGDKNDNIIDIVASNASIDVLRTAKDGNTKKEKTINFKINWMNNDVQVGTQSVATFDAKAVSDGAYQVKVLKNGEDVTNNKYVEVAGNVVTIKPSYAKPVGTRVANVVSGGAVAYDVLGEGVYTLELYKWTKEGTEFVESLEGTADISVSVGDAGKYTTDLANLVSEKVKISEAATGDQYSKTDAEAILKCFLIKNRDGNNVVNANDPKNVKIENMGDGKLYFVDYTAVDGTDTVYVKEIVFYEPVGTGEYVAYTVAIDKALTWDKEAK